MIIVILVLLFLPLSVYPQRDYRDPFESLLPQEEPKSQTRKRKKKRKFPTLSIEGVLWGSDIPQTIINGEVYKIGDKIKGSEAKIIRIEKNIVFISYDEKVYKLETKSKEER